MNAHTRHNTRGMQSVRKLAVDRIVLEELFPEPLMDCEERVHTAFTDLNVRAATTAKITSAAGYENQNFVRKHLWGLVRNGYIAAYRKNGRWVWCDRDTAEKMLASHSPLKRDYDGLPKRRSPDGVEIYEEPL